MTTQEGKDQLLYLARGAGMADVGLERHVDAVMSLGLRELWYRRFWRFRVVEDYEVTVTASDSWFALPAWVAATGTALERSSSQGGKIWYVRKARFDAIIARPDAYASDYQRIYTVKQDYDSGQLYVKFFPIPSATPVYMQVFRHAPDKIDKVPGIAEAALRACMEKHLYPKKPEFTLAWKHARDNAQFEILELERIDRPFGASQVAVFDPAAIASVDVYASRPWLEDV